MEQAGQPNEKDYDSQYDIEAEAGVTDMDATRSELYECDQSSNDDDDFYTSGHGSRKSFFTDITSKAGQFLENARSRIRAFWTTDRGTEDTNDTRQPRRRSLSHHIYLPDTPEKAPNTIPRKLLHERPFIDRFQMTEITEQSTTELPIDWASDSASETSSSSTSTDRPRRRSFNHRISMTGIRDRPISEFVDDWTTDSDTDSTSSGVKLDKVRELSFSHYIPMSDERPRSSPSSDEDDERPYTIFSRWQKIGIITIVAFAGVLSPLSSNIYFPALTAIEQDLGITAQQVNLTVTVYMIFQGLSPVLCGTLSDTWGRRPVYLITIVIYLCGCIGCAEAPSFAVLLIFRMVQSFGSSPVASIGAGIVSDIALPSERGTYFGIYSSVHVIGPVLGPVIGGFITTALSWRFIFWILLVIACVLWLSVFILLPETLRTLVGDGSGYANPTPVQWLRKRLLRKREHRGRNAISRRHKWPNPFLPLKYLVERDVAVVLMYNTLHYAVYCCYTTSTSSLFSSLYDLNELETGLCFLSPGVGCLLGSLLEGRVLDHDFRITECKCKYNGRKHRKVEDLSEEFPVFSARFRTAWIHAPLIQLASIAYGWSLYKSAPLAVPLGLQFIVGFCVTGLYTATQTLLIDLFPDNGATITAANNFIRCFIGAAATAAIQPGIEGVNVGWIFTILGLILVASNISVPVLLKFGPIWRKKRMNKRREKA